MTEWSVWAVRGSIPPSRGIQEMGWEQSQARYEVGWLPREVPGHPNSIVSAIFTVTGVGDAGGHLAPSCTTAMGSRKPRLTHLGTAGCTSTAFHSCAPELEKPPQNLPGVLFSQELAEPAKCL